MRHEPLISIITITYNHERFISECIDSVLKQTYINWELIIVDDESTDATGAIVSSYSDPRIRYLKQPHVGPFELQSTYNKGLELTRGALIAILEGDDFWPPYTLEEQVKSLENEDISLSHGRSLKTTPEGRPIGDFVVVPEEVRNNDPVGIVTKFMLLGLNFSHTSTIVIRREALLSIGGFRGSKSLPTIDFPTLLELGMIGPFAYVDKVLGYHRKHSRSVVGICSSDDESGYFQQLRQYVIDFYKENSSKYCLSGVSEQDIQKAWAAVINHSYLGLGRIALNRGNWQQAYKLFFKSLRGPKLSYRGASTLGIISCTIHVNILEPVLNIVVGHRINDLLDSQ